MQVAGDDEALNDPNHSARGPIWSTKPQYRRYRASAQVTEFGMVVIARYQPIANTNASDDGIFPATVSNQKFSLDF